MNHRDLAALRKELLAPLMLEAVEFVAGKIVRAGGGRMGEIVVRQDGSQVMTTVNFHDRLVVVTSSRASWAGLTDDALRVFRGRPACDWYDHVTVTNLSQEECQELTSVLLARIGPLASLAKVLD